MFKWINNQHLIDPLWFICSVCWRVEALLTSKLAYRFLTNPRAHLPPGNFMIFIVYFIYQLILNVIEHSDHTDVGVALLRNGEEENIPMLDFFLNCCEQSNLVY